MGSIILSIGRDCKLSLTGVIHWPPNTVRKRTSNCVFFLSLCIINYLSVVTKLCLCWEHSESPFWDSELCSSPNSQILHLPSPLPGMCHSQMNGRGVAFLYCWQHVRQLIRMRIAQTNVYKPQQVPALEERWPIKCHGGQWLSRRVVQSSPFLTARCVSH